MTADLSLVHLVRQPAEVATIVAFLASDLAALINGETIAADGGYTAQ